MVIDNLTLLEWSALALSVLCTIGFACMVMGGRRAKRAFRGKGYLRPPTGKAWLRFLYYEHYNSFEDPGIRFFYGVARLCFFGSVILALVIGIYFGSVLVLGKLASTEQMQNS
jgi:hypothetical protein